MGFSNLARRVRDPALPFRWRVSALRSCVQLYRPLGFEATLSFLESRAGRFQRDEAAPLRALEVIEASRAARCAEFQAYTRRRREAKAQGQRSPRPREVNPHVQAQWYWYGAPREAALHALRFWRRRRLTPSADPELGKCASEFLDAGIVLTEAQRCKLEQRLHSWDHSLVLRHLEVASDLR